nr:unnamed protein product [Digitaria exilis]
MVVEEITEGVKNLSVAGDAAAAASGAAGEGSKRGGGGNSNRIQVSNTKKPLFFYVNLAKQHDDVELSALGMVLGKSEKFDELMAAAAEERGEVEDGEEQA